MSVKKPFKNRLLLAIFGCFFAFINIFGSFVNFTAPAYAEPEASEEVTTEVEPSEPAATDATDTTDTTDTASDTATDRACKDQLGAIGWLVCPTTGKIAEAVDWLYDKIEDILIINPISTEDSSPIYNIWKYFRDITNIIFIIYLLIIIYSQITGMGINNYGIKKALPKLIVAVILVNLSFIICSLAVEVSNIIGQSLRGVFTSIEEASLAAGTSGVTKISFSSMYSYIAGGTAAAIAGGAIAIETGAIWMLIPTVLAAIAAVVSGLITIALRQTVVALLIMIAPLAFVANILPNTEEFFKKWKKLLTRMLVFYPLFSLLFGASSLAGWAIISSAKDGFAVLLGMAVQIFPLFFSWSLMKMSGTVLGTINDKLRGIAAKPIAVNRAWADSHRQLTKQKYLASKNAYTPSLRLSQYLSDRRISREGDIIDHATIIKNRGLAYSANRHYRKDGTISKDGEEAYEMQARNIKYQNIIMRDQNNFKKSLSELKDLQGRKSYRNTAQLRRLEALDIDMVNATDSLKYEAARGAKIEFENARGFQERTSRAVDAHFDALNKNNPKYQQHNTNSQDLARYNTMLSVMDHEAKDIHFAAAEAAYSFNAQNQIVQGKFQRYFDLTAPTQDVVNRLSELTTSVDSTKYIDEILSGMRVLNMRGDTDLVTNALNQALSDNKITLGTYAAQSLANFLMFDVKGNDPFLRRFGKYINLETARMYNEADPSKRRHNPSFSIEEYITGEYDEWDENGNPLTDANGNIIKGKVKRDASILLNGTSFKDIERTALSNMQESIRRVCITEDKDGHKHLDVDKYIALQEKINESMRANIVGDQFSFLSGSEQITALGKYVTGMKNKDGKYVTDDSDLDDITFDNENDKKAAEDKLKNFHLKRTKQFFGDQVPNQVARTKSDILAPVKALLVEQAKKEYGPGQEESFYVNKAGETLRRALQGVDKNGNGGVYDSLVKMIDKGYQGDTKAGLVEFLHLNDPNEIIRVRTKNNRKDYDDDEGIPQPMSDDGGQAGNWDLNAIIGEVDRSFMADQSNTRDNIDRFISEMDEMLIERGLDDVAQAFNEYYRNNSTASIQSLRNCLENLLRKYNS